MYMNRMLVRGMQDDFHIKQVRGGDLMKEPIKEFEDLEI